MGQLRDEGVTILLTTQYLEEADVLSDNIVVIDKGGRVIAQGTSDELKEATGAAYCEVTPTHADDLPRLQEVLADLIPPDGASPPTRTSWPYRPPRVERRHWWRSSVARPRPRSNSRTSRCGVRRSTRCSWRSPIPTAAGGSRSMSVSQTGALTSSFREVPAEARTRPLQQWWALTARGGLEGVP